MPDLTTFYCSLTYRIACLNPGCSLDYVRSLHARALVLRFRLLPRSSLFFAAPLARRRPKHNGEFAESTAYDRRVRASLPSLSLLLCSRESFECLRSTGRCLCLCARIKRADFRLPKNKAAVRTGEAEGLDGREVSKHRPLCSTHLPLLSTEMVEIRDRSIERL